MFFFLNLRQSSTRPGTIEPDILPSSAASTNSRTGLFQQNGVQVKESVTRWSDGFGAWLRNWEWDDTGALVRKLACILALVLHIPMNIITMFQYGASLWLVFGIIISVLNLFCLAIALWRLDEMRGSRLVYNSIWTRTTFDYIILALFIVYGISFGMFVRVLMGFKVWKLFFHIIWPCIFVADITAFISGWFCTWRDVGVPVLG